MGLHGSAFFDAGALVARESRKRRTTTRGGLVASSSPGGVGEGRVRQGIIKCL